MFEQMKGLSPKKKIEYYIQYYGAATAVILIMIIAVTSFVVGRIRAKDVAEGIMLINAYGEASEDEETYLDDLLTGYGIDPAKNKIEVNGSIYISEDGENTVDPQMALASSQKIIALASSDSCDVFFSDDSYFATAESDGMCEDLSDYIDEGVIEAHKDDLYYCNDPETGKEILAGIRVSCDSGLMGELGWYTEDPIVGIIVNPSNPELAAYIVEAMLN